MPSTDNDSDLDNALAEVTSLKTEARLLRDTVGQQRRWIFVIAFCLASLVVPTVIATAGYIRQGDTLTELTNCTTPGPDEPSAENGFKSGHRCYDDGQARTAEAVHQIVCAVRPDAEGC